jgi:hypothetical protein
MWGLVLFQGEAFKKVCWEGLQKVIFKRSDVGHWVSSSRSAVEDSEVHGVVVVFLCLRDRVRLG